MNSIDEPYMNAEGEDWNKFQREAKQYLGENIIQTVKKIEFWKSPFMFPGSIIVKMLMWSLRKGE